MRYCTQCGAAATPEQAFCTRCGAPLTRPPAEPPAAEPPADSPAAAPDEAAETLPGGLSAPGGSQPAPPAGLAPAEILTQDRPPGRRAGKVIVVAVVLLALGGGAAAWALLSQGNSHHTAGGSLSPAPRQQPPASTSPPAPASTTSQPVADSTAPASPAPATRQGTVTIGPAASQQAGAQQVAAFLSDYFQAINNREYHRYSALFEPQLRPTLQEFESGYRSTRDSGEVLTGVTGASAGLAAAVRFRSHQRPADSPTATSCTSWRIVLYLTPHGSSYRIVHAPPGYHARYRAC